MASSGGCLALWRAENDRLVQRWRKRVTRPPDSDSSVKQTAQECHVAFTKLLQKIQGLPPVLSAVPLELTVLYNVLLFDIHLSNNFGKNISMLIEQGLKRVLEACAVSDQDQDLCSKDIWPRVFQQKIPEELQAPLHQLTVLQGAFWLARNQLNRVKELFRLLPGAKSPGLFVDCGNELLSLLQAKHPCDAGESHLLVVQSVRDLKDIVWTSAAFLQGVQELEADNLRGALAFLQAAATGLCSKRVLAQIFTLMGTCNHRIGKPQTALQHLKRALQVDFTFLLALDQAAMLYRQLDLVEAELETLSLLYQALDDPVKETQEFSSPHFLIQTELLTCGFHPTAVFVQSSPPGVKYMLSQRCLQAGKASEAAEHYLDLLALFQEGPLPQVFLNDKLAMPRIPEVFLEAASALEEVGRHHEAIMVCEEVVSRTSELIPKKLPVVLGWSSKDNLLGMERSSAKSPGIILKQQRESLHCILWRAAAYLIQGCARAQLGEAKEAISNFSRCLNDLLRVQVVGTGSQRTEQEREEMAIPEAELLSQIRHLALTGRGAQFLGLGRDKEALMDFQHSQHFSPGVTPAPLYLLYTLWKMDRRQEVAAHWEKLHSEPGVMEEEAELCPGYSYS